MKNIATPIGIGCFAESATLCRVFRKALEILLLNKYEDICPLSDRAPNDMKPVRFFSSVIRYGTEKPDQMGSLSISIPESAKISGFFLGLNKQALYLILFFLDGGRQRTRLTARLEKFSRLRAKSLH